MGSAMARAEAERTGRALAYGWPGALGLGLAVSILATGAAETASLAITAPAAAFCYLAAAASGRPWAAWVAIPGAVLVVTGARAFGAPWWAGLGLAGLALLILGWRRAAGRAHIAWQAAGLAAFGAVGGIALTLAPTAAVLVAGLGLAAHSIWDWAHLRADAVVPRPMAEGCLFLDAPLGIGFIVIALT